MEELLEILEDIHPEVDFENNERLIDDGILDSFDIVTLVSTIMTEFNVVITAEELLPENFNSAKAIYALIQKKEDEED